MALRARPLHDRIIVRRETADEMTAGGIVIPFREGKPQRSGEVLAAGPGVINERGVLIPVSLKPGDRVLFGAYAGTEIKIDGESYQVMRESDVACLLDADADVETDGLSSPRSEVSSHYR